MNNRPKILVVWPDKAMRDLLCILLKSEKYEVCTASNGEDCILKVKTEIPDLIIMTYMMPVMDGLTACKILKSDHVNKELSIIFSSGNNVEAEIAAYDLGIDHSLHLPFTSQLFKVLVKNSLMRRGFLMTNSTATIKIPKVFISYKWESNDHNDWVMKFAVDLRSAGIEAFLDRWEVKYGESFSDYMTSRISEADAMLFVMTTASVDAVESKSRAGGALKFEMQLAASRRIAGENFRLIPIYREGNKTAAHVRDHRYVDFRDDANYVSNLQLLISDLLNDESLAPPIGTAGRRASL